MAYGTGFHIDLAGISAAEGKGVSARAWGKQGWEHPPYRHEVPAPIVQNIQNEQLGIRECFEPLVSKKGSHLEEHV